MNEIKRIKSVKKASLFMGSLVFTVICFAFIPSLLHMYRNKVYKAFLNKNKIDFDNMGPEIMQKSN